MKSESTLFHGISLSFHDPFSVSHGNTSNYGSKMGFEYLFMLTLKETGNII